MSALPYADAAPGGPLRLREHPLGTSVLVMGFLGVLLCPILAPIAWVQGRSALAEIDRDRWGYGNRGSVAVGRALGIWGTIQAGVLLAIFAASVALFSTTTAVDHDPPSTTATTLTGPP